MNKKEKLVQINKDYLNKRAQIDKDYEEQLAPINKDYENKRAPINKDYENKRCQINKDYLNKRAQIDKDYEEQLAPINKDYENLSENDVSYEDEKSFDKPHYPANVELPKTDIQIRFECARVRCPMNKDGLKCVDVTNWFRCRRQIEP
jgi:hypothetical protein